MRCSHTYVRPEDACKPAWGLPCKIFPQQLSLSITLKRARCVAVRIIADHFLDRWWADLDRTLSTNDFVDVERIHKLQC